jgi:hypothetical protein
MAFSKPSKLEMAIWYLIWVFVFTGLAFGGWALYHVITLGGS